MMAARDDDRERALSLMPGLRSLPPASQELALRRFSSIRDYTITSRPAGGKMAVVNFSESGSEMSFDIPITIVRGRATLGDIATVRKRIGTVELDNR